MATLTDLPPHVWALVLRNAMVHDLFVVAHVCRALHELIASSATCTCATVSETPTNRTDGASARSRAFWTHWRDVHPPPSLDEWQMLVQRGHVTHIGLAMRCGADPSARNQFAVRFASSKGHVHVVNLLLRDERVDPSVAEQYTIGFASCNGHVEVVDRLLRDARVDPGADSQWAIRHASSNGHVNVVERLLRDARVDPSTGNQCAMRWAIDGGHLAMVQCLLRDERVARDVAALRERLIHARERGYERIATLLELHCAERCALGVIASS